MIKIQKSGTADTRTCDFKTVTKETLYESSVQHRGDVIKGIEFFIQLLYGAANIHDFDKLSDIDGFHRDFITGFENTEWWDEHRKLNRHHLLQKDGVPEDVNLVDVLELVVDCVMAGMGRSGDVYPLNIDPAVLMKAFQNTVTMLKEQVQVVEYMNSDPQKERCKHPGCKHHVTHPCEDCGKIGGKEPVT